LASLLWLLEVGGSTTLHYTTRKIDDGEEGKGRERKGKDLCLTVWDFFWCCYHYACRQHSSAQQSKAKQSKPVLNTEYNRKNVSSNLVSAYSPNFKSQVAHSHICCNTYRSDRQKQCLNCLQETWSKKKEATVLRFWANRSFIHELTAQSLISTSQVSKSHTPSTF